MYDLAIFTALAWERRAVLAALRDVAPASTTRTWHGRLTDGTSCLVAQTGVGPEHARRVATAASDARLFVSSGCAGALVEDLRPGDVVVADGVAELDASGAPAERFVVDSAALASWVHASNLRVHVGGVASSAVVLPTAGAKRRAAACGAIAVDMESGALARVALARGIPLLVVRVVIDAVTDAVPETSGVLDPDTGNVRVGPAVAAMVHPRNWPATVRLARRAWTAERHFRRFLARLFTDGGGIVMAGLSRPRG
jgi:adenosylhomocysteine nucleosidase